MQKIPVIYSEEYLTDYRTVDCESPDRIAMIHFMITELAEFVEPRACTMEDLRLCHSDRIIRTVKQEGEVFEVAQQAAGGAIKAAEIAMERPSFALIRPPGHHAGHNFNGGFCFFNNMAIAVTSLLARGLVKSALIIDIDLHYGNGTEDILKDDNRIAFKNIDARSRPEFFEYFEEALGDAASYDVLACSAGFDTYIKDWGQMLHTKDYHTIAHRLARANPRFFTLLEGGYYIDDLGINVRAYLEGLRDACL